MSQALEGAPRPGPTLTEQANSRRIGRATFIGHSIGWLILFGLIGGALAYLGLGREVAYEAVLGFADPPQQIRQLLPGFHPWATIGLAALGFIVWADLGVRRRHDRNRSGADVMLWLTVMLAEVIVHSFDLAPLAVAYVDAALLLGGLYLLVVLVFLPGQPGENRYGPRPGAE
jgi:uncharacterized membrane protein YhaH (DUF805 family)